MIEADKIVFMAEYPNELSIKEGMSQRMVAVDNQFIEDERVYLLVSHRFFRKSEKSECKAGVYQYKCNLFFHFLFILRTLSRSKFIYFHSIQNVLPILPILWFLKKDKRMILDIHGVVPEEHALAGQNIKSIFYNISEKYIFNRLLLAISVTNAMKRHFEKKYPSNNVKMVIYPILPSHIDTFEYPSRVIKDDGEINVIYSGNMQVWQNIDLMVNVIANNLSPSIKYTILTGAPDDMMRFLDNRGLSEMDNVFVDSVNPELLGTYYKKAHYGFILRDDIIVNRVACPTKIIEYMHYGIIPIVKSVEVGDFFELDYEFLEVENFNVNELHKNKSIKNNRIISKIKLESEHVNIKSYLNMIN